VTALPPGATLGILGGGQLGRMLGLAAARLGMRVAVFEPDPDCPAAQVANLHVAAPYDDGPALDAFGGACDVVTYEFENVPVAAVRRLGALVPVRPGVAALETAQDRLAEKRFLNGLGLATAPFAAAEEPGALVAAAAAIGFPGILKTRWLGYDGKGQVPVVGADDLATAIPSLGRPAGLIYEGKVDFAREVSVVAVRVLSGRIDAFDPAENVHRGGILRTSTVPARIAPATAAAARAEAAAILDALSYVGVLGVEFFVLGEGEGERLLVNEIAPRVHNSGHWTEAACSCSQFEAHVRAVLGWPVPPLSRHADAVMENLIGEDAARWAELAAEPGASLHLYGKREARPGRKMGHVVRLR